MLGGATAAHSEERKAGPRFGYAAGVTIYHYLSVLENANSMDRKSFMGVVGGAVAAAALPFKNSEAIAPAAPAVETWCAANRVAADQAIFEMKKYADTTYPDYDNELNFAACAHDGCKSRFCLDVMSRTKGSPHDWQYPRYPESLRDATYAECIHEKVCQNLGLETPDIGHIFINNGWILWSEGYGGTHGTCPDHWGDSGLWFDKFDHKVADCPKYACVYDKPSMQDLSQDREDHPHYKDCGRCGWSDHECVQCGLVAGDSVYYAGLCVMCVFRNGRATLTDVNEIAYVDKILAYLQSGYDAARQG